MNNCTVRLEVWVLGERKFYNFFLFVCFKYECSHTEELLKFELIEIDLKNLS